MNQPNTIQILYAQHLAKFGSKEAVIAHHTQFLSDYAAFKVERNANSEIKARLLTKILKVAKDGN